MAGRVTAGAQGETTGWRVILFTDFAGVADFYRALLASQGHRLVAIVTAATRDFGYLEVVRAAQPEIDVLVSSHPRRWAAMLAPLRPDLIVTTVFPRRIPADVLALARLGAVNVHPSLLPRYRGTDIPLWMMRHGEREWGMSLHRMVADFDAGPVLAQERVALGDDNTLATMMPKLFAAMPPLWAAALPRIAAGDPGDPQDEAAASYFGHIADLAAWRRLDWALPAREVHNVVRSCYWPIDDPHRAEAALEGQSWRIIRTRLADVPASNAPPGTVVGGRDGDLLVQCGDGPILVLERKPAADPRETDAPVDRSD
jgi:methionyl-tRNA formyltransferase